MAHCVEEQGIFNHISGITRLKDGSWESRIDALGHSIGLGSFRSYEQAELARSSFLASVDLPPQWTEACSAASPAMAAFIARNSGMDTAASTGSPRMHVSTHVTEHDVPAPPSGQPCATSTDDVLASVSTSALGLAEVNRGKRNHGLPKGITRRPNSVKFECKVHMNGKRFYVGLFSTLEEALAAQAEKRLELLEAARQAPGGKVQAAARTTGEDELQKLKVAIATGDSLEKVKGLRKRKNGRWETQIMHKGKRHYLGTYDTAEQALEARNQRARELSITGATLPSKTPGPHRSKRGTAQPGPVPGTHMPVAAVPPSVPHGNTHRMSDVVYAAPSHAGATLHVRDTAAEDQSALHAGVLPLTKRPRTASPLRGPAAPAPHAATAPASTAEPRAMYSEPLHIGSIAEAQHTHACQPRSGPYTNIACADDLALSVPIGTSTLPQPLKMEATLMHKPGLGGVSAVKDIARMSGAEALGRASGLQTGPDVQNEPANSMSGNAAPEMASSGSVGKGHGMGSGELLPFDAVQGNVTEARLLHDSHGLSVHDDIHEEGYAGSDYGSFPGDDALQDT